MNLIYRPIFRIHLWLLLISASCVGMFTSFSITAEGLAKYLRPDHPEVYTVIKADTLWDISGAFLSRPWLWPEIWQINPQIENPHLIYPGDEISLVYVDGQPRLSLSRGDAGRTIRLTPSGTVSLKPQIRSTLLKSSILAISLDSIQGFLVQNRVVEPGILEAGPYVVEGEAERLILGTGDRVYVSGMLAEHKSFSIVRKGPMYVDPQRVEC